MKNVTLPPSVYQTIITHALTHEKEEIAGLLCCETHGEIIQVYAAIPLPRSLQQDDRVEISPEQLSVGMEKCSEMSAILGIPLRILGWYHSHPHITVLPSDHDVNTQSGFQQLDNDFFGLIASVFDVSSDFKTQTIRFHGFRAQNRKSQELEVSIKPLDSFTISKNHLYDVCLDMWCAIAHTVFTELENDSNEENSMVRTLKVLSLSQATVFPMATCCEYLKLSMLSASENNC